MAKSRGKEPVFAQIENAARAFKALADADRLRIINALRGGTKNVGELAKILGAVIVNVSHHLSVLRATEVVKDEKRGRFVYYSLHPDNYRSDDKGEVLTLGQCRFEILK